MATKESEIVVAATEVQPTGGQVSVVAPSDMLGGYQLQVQIDGMTKTVTVPPGGVKQGEQFMAIPTDGPMASSSAPLSGVGIPTGRFRDGICDCCAFGCCHPMCCFAFWCGPIVLGQVMTRMNLNFLGGPGEKASTSNTCITVTAIYLVYIVVESALSGATSAASPCGDFGGSNRPTYVYNDTTGEFYWQCPDGTSATPSGTYNFLSGLTSLWQFAFFIYVLIAMIRTRMTMRNKYQIPGTCCGDGCLGDCCCSYWCSCCVISQMARHTNDYNMYPVSCCGDGCCSKRGQPDQAPFIDP